MLALHRNALLAALVAFLLPGCTSESTEAATLCFPWPSDPCPSVEDAPLYMSTPSGGALVEKDGCGTSLQSIDGPPQRSLAQCCYAVTLKEKSCPPDALL